MEKLILRISQDHPNLVFSAGQSHCWSPEQGQISYADLDEAYGIEGLLHELGHARLEHHGYVSDLDLLKKEVAAWQEAKRLASQYRVKLDNNHIEDCLDTYRDWIYKRSCCPNCMSTGVQDSPRSYLCLNCRHSWKITASRFGRPYRLSKSLTT